MLPETCKPCSLYSFGCTNRTKFSQVSGTGVSGVLAVGEASGDWEAVEGRPFVEHAPAGSLLAKALRWQGIDRDSLSITNIVRCKPPRNHLDGAEYEREAIDNCRKYLDAVVAERKPRALLALGGIALRELTGLSGQKLGISNIRGFILESRYGVPLVSTFHPSFIMRGATHLLGVVIRDIRLAMQVAANGVSAVTTAYQLAPTPSEVIMWLSQTTLADPISVDIETDSFEKDDADFVRNARITQIQFSKSIGDAIVLPFIESYFPVIQAVLASANPKWSWNGRLFDWPILKSAGLRIEGEHHDLMLAWKHLQPDFDAESRLLSLQSCTSFYAPEFGVWKHQSSVDLPLYGAKDADATYRCGVGLMRDLRKRGLWEGYYKHKFQLKDVLDDLGVRGLPVDAQKQSEFREQVLSESTKLSAELQSQVPREICDVHPKAGYRKVPKDTTGMELRKFGDAERWCKVLDFNPNSSQQLLRYIKYRGYKVPKKWGEDKETTGKDALEKLQHQTGDQVIGLVREIRKMNKLVSAFTSGNWVPNGTGRVHPTFLFGTATGQLSCVRPNIQQYPVHGDLAKKFKSMIRAEPEHTFVNLDFRSFHARSLGWISLDVDYYKLADYDVHSFVTSHFLRLPQSDLLLELSEEQLRSRLSWIKSEYKDIRDQKAKRAILALGFHMGVNKLYLMNSDSFNPPQSEVELLAGKSWSKWDDARRQVYINKHGLAEAKKLVLLIQRLFPRAFVQFPIEIEDRIKRTSKCYLRSPAGHNRWLWDLNLEEAVAFLPANIAHAHIDDVALRLQQRGLLDRYQLVNWRHDDFLFHCPNHLVGECIESVHSEMIRPSEVCVNELGAFQCNADVKVGTDMASLSEFHPERNPEGMR